MNRDRARFRLSVLITTVAAVLAVGHVVFPTIAVDAITVALLIAAVSPWLGHVFKAFEVAGTRFEYPDLLRAEAEVTKAGLTAPATSKQRDALPASAQDDALIALAALRIELERRLRSLAELRGVKIGDRPGSIAMLAGR